jgi:uncharacterized protein (TIGR02996 family)
MSRDRYTPLPLPEAFEAALDRRPSDWELRSVIADWFEENSDAVAANCMRWQVREHKRPERNRFYEPEGKWGWWVLFPDPWTTEVPMERELPEPLWKKLPPKIDSFTGFRVYPTRAAAEYALRVAWGRLTPRQREMVSAWPKPAGRKKRSAPKRR